MGIKAATRVLIQNKIPARRDPGWYFDRVAVIRFITPPKRFKGFAKDKGYAYPHSVIVGDNLWVIYSVNKENIQLTRIPLIELYKL